MNAAYNKILQALELRQFAPVYLADGEESYYIDKLTDYFENNILAPAERDFNLTVLYGKDALWQDVVGACRRFPMFAERQVVILKDAAQLRGGEGDEKGLNSLLNYIEKPSPSTVFFIEHPFKKADVRTKFVKRVKDKGIHFTSDKIKDEQLPDWIEGYGRESGFLIARHEAEMLASYLGADLQKVVNEIQKIRINVPDEKHLTAQLIQKYIGISKEYNIFDFPVTLTGNDHDKLYKMLSFFISNSKAAPMPLLIGAFYTHFNRLYTAHFVRGKTDKEAAAALGMSPYFVKGVMAALSTWPLQRVERCMLLLSKYNAKTVGIGSAADDRELLKEMVGRMLET
jgi:DNA polymerase-3 subunit delta